MSQQQQQQQGDACCGPDKPMPMFCDVGCNTDGELQANVAREGEASASTNVNNAGRGPAAWGHRADNARQQHATWAWPQQPSSTRAKRKPTPILPPHTMASRVTPMRPPPPARAAEQPPPPPPPPPYDWPPPPPAHSTPTPVAAAKPPPATATVPTKARPRTGDQIATKAQPAMRVGRSSAESGLGLAAFTEYCY